MRCRPNSRRASNTPILPLAEQLEDHGIRKFELEVFADPDGGLFASRAANAVVGLDPASGLPELDAPGFRMMPPRTSTTAPPARHWSAANPDHVPMMIMIETKEQSVLRPSAGPRERLL